MSQPSHTELFAIFQYIDTLIISIDITFWLSVMRYIDMLTYCCSSTEAFIEGSAENLAAMQPDMLCVYGTRESIYIKLHALPPPLQRWRRLRWRYHVLFDDVIICSSMKMSSCALRWRCHHALFNEDVIMRSSMKTSSCALRWRRHHALIGEDVIMHSCPLPRRKIEVEWLSYEMIVHENLSYSE